MNRRVLGGVAVFTAAAILIVNAAIGGGQTENPNTFPATDTEESRYVTITFDDAYRSQYHAADALEERGMEGVFYVPVNQLNGTFEGIPTMTRAQVQQLAQRGHEIGGHTFNHTDMSTLTAAEVQGSLQRNRDALQVLGISPVSFGYPYGKGAEHSAVVAQYYEYGRAGGWQENTMPPQQPETLSAIAVTEETVDVLDDYLDRLDGGDWLIIAVHGVDTDGAVDRPSIDVSQETYERMLDMIQQENATVVTFQDLEGGQ